MNSVPFKVCLRHDPINITDALHFIQSPHCGGTNIFIGTTRVYECTPDKKVKFLIYEAYEEMAVKVMEDIVRKQLDSIGDEYHRVYVCHRLGQVSLGEQSILIAVSSPHRSSSHQMVMQILNEIKSKAPVWKKVCFDNGDSDWSNKSEAFWLQN